MTARRRGPASDRVAFQFLVEEFSDVDDQKFDPEAVIRFRQEAAQTFLGLDDFWATDPMAPMPPAEFQQLRRLTRNWLRSLVVNPAIGHRVTLPGPLYLTVLPNETPHGRRLSFGATPIWGDLRDVFWFYVVSLIHRIGVTQIGVCSAPQSKWKSATLAMSCGRLFVRRGTAKQFCTETCRARVATQRARGVEAPALQYGGRGSPPLPADVGWTVVHAVDISSRDSTLTRAQWDENRDSMRRARHQQTGQPPAQPAKRRTHGKARRKR